MKTDKKLTADFLTRLKEFCKIKGIPLRTLARQLNLNDQYFYQVKGSKIPVEVVIQILKMFPELSTEWLFRNQGSMVVDSSVRKKTSKRVTKKEILVKEQRTKRIEEALVKIKLTENAVKKEFNKSIKHLNESAAELEKILRKESLI